MGPDFLQPGSLITSCFTVTSNLETQCRCKMTDSSEKNVSLISYTYRLPGLMLHYCLAQLLVHDIAWLRCVSVLLSRSSLKMHSLFMKRGKVYLRYIFTWLCSFLGRSLEYWIILISRVTRSLSLLAHCIEVVCGVSS